jgi:serine phosphatase RsbU (regulator of sigma subunit)
VRTANENQSAGKLRGMGTKANPRPFIDPDPGRTVAKPPSRAGTVRADPPALHPQTYDAAALLVEHLFTPRPKTLDGIEYAVEYRLAQGDAGGDVVDVYLFDNASVAFSVSDIAGKGARAAVHAALIKFGLRAYASEGATPERTLAALNRLYIENSGDEADDSFATVFFGHVDSERRVMGYASAAHDPVLLAQPGESPVVLPTTAPIIGVFDSHVHLFKQRYVEIQPGAILVAVTDGITDARQGNIELFGIERVRRYVEECRDEPMAVLAKRIMDNAMAFWATERMRDDMAVLAVRFL